MKIASRLVVGLALTLISAGASAHGSVKGLGDFFSGVVHPLLEPAHLVGLAAFSLLIGPRFDSLKPTALWFAGGCVLGGVCVALGARLDTDTLLLAASALVGLAVVIARPLPRLAYEVAAGTIGIAIGLGSRSDGVAGAAVWVMLAGSCLGAPVFMVNLAMLVEAMKKPWMRILIRVFGSWTTACSILVLSLIAAGHPLNSITDPASSSGTVAPLDNVRRN